MGHLFQRYKYFQNKHWSVVLYSAKTGCYCWCHYIILTYMFTYQKSKTSFTSHSYSYLRCEFLLMLAVHIHMYTFQIINAQLLLYTLAHTICDFGSPVWQWNICLWVWTCHLITQWWLYVNILIHFPQNQVSAKETLAKSCILWYKWSSSTFKCFIVFYTLIKHFFES